MPAIRHQVNIAVPTRTVWAALTTADGLMSWWADEARVDAREGGIVVVTTEGDDGEPVEERGTFLTLRPTRKIEIKWDKGSTASTAGTRITFQLAKDGPETRLSLVHSGGGVLDDEEARAVLDKDWHRALRGLRDSLESEAG